MNRTINNYALALQNARKYFLEWNQTEIIERGQLRADERFLYLNFLAQPFRIRRDTGEVENLVLGQAAGFEESLSIYDYLCRIGPLPRMEGELRSAGSLRHAGQSSPSEVRLHQRQADYLQAHRSALEPALARLSLAPFPQGDYACRFAVFDALSAVFQFWEGDEEFPPSVRFLWCENVLDFLKFETLYYVMGCFFHRLESQMEEIEKKG